MKLQIIVGSTRIGRVSDRVAAWVAAEAKTLTDTTVEVVELAAYPMPFFDEAIPPQYNPARTPLPAVASWLSKLAEADAYVIVTPEYNRSYTGVLKNALDYIDFQLSKKPVAIVAHGSTGGAQAVGQLRGIIPALQAVSVPAATFLMGRVSDMLDEAGVMSEELKNNPYGPQAALRRTLEDTKWYSDALTTARK